MPPEDPDATAAAAPAAGDVVSGEAVPTTRPTAEAGIVDWQRTGRRLRRQFLVVLAVVVVAWVVIGIGGDGPTLRSFAELLGLGVLVSIAGEIVIVGGAALRGMVAAGDRGDRLAADDVSLLPPQVTRRLRRRRG